MGIKREPHGGREMGIIDNLKKQEAEAIVKGFAGMAYIPSIGRVLKRGGVDKFINLMSENVEKLERINDQAGFDAFHDQVVSLISKEIKTIRGEEPSYGQAQKPLNVFLKVFVDWANKPTPEEAMTLRPFLHVPLDSIVMKAIKDNFPSDYSLHVVQEYDRIRELFGRRDDVRAKLQHQGEKAVESSLKGIINPANFSLSRIFLRDMYYAWQKCLRSIHPDKPVLLDIFWFVNRDRPKKGRRTSPLRQKTS